MDGMITRPALPMRIDVRTNAALYVSAFQRLNRRRKIVNWIMFGLGCAIVAASVLNIALNGTAVLKDMGVRFGFFLGIFYIVYSIYGLFALKKQITGAAQAFMRLGGDFEHYEISEEGVFISSLDGYSFRTFANLYKVASYSDMWFLYFGDRFAPTVFFVFKCAFPDSAAQASFEALLNEKLAGKSIINYS